jgi:hypothetical protein
MSEKQPKPDEQEVIQYAEEVDQELAQLRAAVWDLIDRLDDTGLLIDLETGCGGNGPVIRLCHMISKPLPPNLKAWLERVDVAADRRSLRSAARG